MHYEEVGHGRPVILFHGLPSDHRQMVHHFEPIFSERDGWRRIYLDMPGMGQTPGADSIQEYDEMVRIASEFVDSVAGEEPVTLIGASWGGFMVQAVAATRTLPLAGVMLTEPMTTEGDRDLPEPTVLVSEDGIADFVEHDEELWLKVAVIQTTETLEAFRAAIKPGAMIADHAFLARVRSNPPSFDVRQPPTPITAPALIVTGRQDAITGYRDPWSIIEQYPRASFVVLDRAGHPVATEQEALFRVLTHEWLDRVEEHLDAA